MSQVLTFNDYLMKILFGSFFFLGESETPSCQITITFQIQRTIEKLVTITTNEIMILGHELLVVLGVFSVFFLCAGGFKL